MKIEDIKNNYYFENLTAEHDVSDFDCGDEDLNDFLKNDALELQNSGLNVTKLIIYDGEIIGYTSLLTDVLVLKNIQDEKLRVTIKGQLGIKSKNRHLPAIKIGRLALDKKYSNKGIGSHILRNILINMKKFSKSEVGFRFIIVEGYAKAFNFYVAKNGFKYLEKDIDQVKKIDFISQRNPNKRFYLYFDLYSFN